MSTATPSERVSAPTGMLVAPDLDYAAATLPLMPMLSSFPKDPSNYVDARKWMATEYPKLPKVIQAERFQPPITCRMHDVPITYGDNKEFSVRVYEPDLPSSTPAELLPALIVVHGGGWIHGGPSADEDTSEFFCSEIRGVVVSVDYSLAPEHPFPRPHDDLFEVLDWMVANAAKYSIDPRRIAMWGCSAGGNLAASVALRDSIDSPSRLAYVSLVVPVTCHPRHFPSSVVDSIGSAPEGAEMDGYLGLWDMYAPGNFAHPLTSVLLSTPSKYHPPTIVSVAGGDLLFNEGVAYALHLRNAGIDCQLDISPGVPHGLTMCPGALVAKQFWRNQARAFIFGLDVKIVKEPKSVKGVNGKANGFTNGFHA